MSDEIKVSVVKYPDRVNLVLRYIDPMTGKFKTKSAKTTNHREAQKAAGKWQAELREGRYHAPNRLTWAEFRSRYEDEVLASLAESTDKKVTCVFNAIEKLLSPSKLTDLTAARLSYLQSKLRDAKRAESTIKGHMAHIAAALAWAVTMGLLVKAPKISMPKRAKASSVMKGRPLTGEEFDRLLDKVEAGLLTAEKPVAGKLSGCKPKRQRKSETVAKHEALRLASVEAVAGSWRHLLRGLWLSGLRLGESLELCWDQDDKLCVDLSGKRPMLRIPAALEKGNRDRLLPIAPEFAEFLLATPEDKRTGYVFAPLPQRPKRTGRLAEGTVIRVILRHWRESRHQDHDQAGRHYQIRVGPRPAPQFRGPVGVQSNAPGAHGADAAREYRDDAQILRGQERPIDRRRALGSGRQAGHGR